MKVLRVISSMDPSSGGPCQGIRNSVPILNNSGIYNEVLCMDSPDASFIGTDNFVIHAIGPASSYWNYTARLIPWLLSNFHNFDAVIVHGLWLHHTYAVYKAIKAYGKQKPAEKIPRVFIMPHGMLDPYFQKAPDRKIKAFRNLLYWHFIEKKVINNAYGLLFTCETELELARQTFAGYHPKNEFNVNYGIIAPPDFSPEMDLAFKKLSKNLGDEYILFLSRIHPKKGVDILIKAYERVLRDAVKREEKVPKLMIAGPGLNESYGKEMLEIVADSEILSGNVIFTGMLTGDAKWAVYHKCKAFVLPSHQENFGISVVEALACSKPVLISNQVNIWKEIITAKAGIVGNNTIDGTVELLIGWVKMDSNQQEEMSRQAYRAYQKYFTIENAAQRLRAVLTQ